MIWIISKFQADHRKGYSLSILFLLIARELRAIGNKERIGIGRKKKLKK